MDINPTIDQESPDQANEAGKKAKLVSIISAGLTGEAVAGSAAIILAILGLIEVVPFYMLTIAVICTGGAMFLEGSAIASQIRQIDAHLIETAKSDVLLGGGMAFEVLGGITGIVLDILAILGIATDPLVSVAVLVMGSALILGAGATERLARGRAHLPSYHYAKAHWIQDSVFGSAGLQVLAGLAAVTLGIIALSGVVPMILDLVALLCISGSIVMAGAAVASKKSAASQHR
jgi:hypothetical protein